MKFVKVLLCMAILLSSVSGVFAAEDSGITEALTQVKQRVDTSEYANFKSSYYKNDGKTSYYFNWSNDDENYSSLYIDFEDGIIKSYGKYEDEEDDGIDAFTLNEADAVEIAKAFIKRINPDIYENIELVPYEDMSIYSDEYSMNLYRMENGIPVLGQTGYVSVSKRTKEVSSFYIDYETGIKFEPQDNIISEAEAKEAYKKLIPPVLRYKYKRDYQKKEMTAYLEYAPKDSSLAINASDGKPYEMMYGGDVYYSKSMKAEGDNAEEMRFTPAELEETEKISGLLSEARATDTAKKNEIIAMPKGFEREYISLNRRWFDSDEYIYDLGFSKDEDYISVSIDAKNGEILSFNNYNSDEKKDKKDRKTEEKKANKAFSVLAGEKASEFRIEESEDAGFVRFVRTVNGIDATDDGAYFDFDNSDNIVAYSLSYSKNVDFPSAEGVISPDAAADAAFAALGFELGYEINSSEKVAQLIYYIGKNGQSASFMINPFTAELIGYNGEALESTQKITYSDIDGHYAEEIFLALADYGIGISGGELRPDEAITQADYIMLLNKAFGYEADVDEVYKRMIRDGVLSAEERADDSLLTRENAAIFMIREIGAERYARYEDIFSAPFADVTENKGYIAILKAEKIISGAGDGNFYPKNTVTRGEALIMIYKYFAK